MDHSGRITLQNRKFLKPCQIIGPPLPNISPLSQSQKSVPVQPDQEIALNFPAEVHVPAQVPAHLPVHAPANVPDNAPDDVQNGGDGIAPAQSEVTHQVRPVGRPRGSRKRGGFFRGNAARRANIQVHVPAHVPVHLPVHAPANVPAQVAGDVPDDIQNEGTQAASQQQRISNALKRLAAHNQPGEKGLAGDEK